MLVLWCGGHGPLSTDLLSSHHLLHLLSIGKILELTTGRDKALYK